MQTTLTQQVGYNACTAKGTALRCARSRGLPSDRAARSGDLTERREFARQRIGPLRDVAGAKAHDDVVRLREPRENAGKLLRAVERDDLAMPSRAQALDERVAVGAGDRRFAGGIDVRDDHRVGVVETGGEL